MNDYFAFHPKVSIYFTFSQTTSVVKHAINLLLRRKSYSGALNVRLTPATHRRFAMPAKQRDCF